MKKQGKTLFKIFFGMVLVTSTFTAPIASAQDASVVQILNQIAARIDSIVSVVASYIFQPTPNLGNTVTTNYTNYTINPQILNQVQGLIDPNLSFGLSPSSPALTVNLTMLTKALPASDTAIVPTTLQTLQSSALDYLKAGGAPTSQNTQQQNLASNNQNFNYQSLISYPVYTPSGQNYALNFIKTVADLATPISSFSLQDKINTDKDFNSLQTKYKQQVINDVEDSATYQTYQAKRRTLLAQQSAGLVNLYRIYAKRIPQPSLQAGDTAIGTPAPSIQQIEDYIATWRVSNPTWYQQMSTAAPATIARETLFVLAEIQKELHAMRMDNERMLTLMSINQVQSVSGAKAGLKVAEPATIQVYTDAIAKAKKAQDQASGKAS